MAPRFEESRVPPPAHSEAQERVIGCRHRVRIPRSAWPPRERRGNEMTPHVDAYCQRCGALVLAEDPPGKHLEVVLYGDAEAAHGQVIQEPVGQVLEESALPPEPAAGTVIDESARPRGRRGA